MILVLDENIPPSVAVALAALKEPYAHVLDFMDRGTEDERIFEAAAERGWYLVTHDKNMWRKPAQRQAMLASGIGVFVLVSSARFSPPDLTELLLRRRKEIMKFAKKTPLPFVLRLPDRGKITSFG